MPSPLYPIGTALLAAIMSIQPQEPQEGAPSPSQPYTVSKDVKIEFPLPSPHPRDTASTLDTPEQRWVF
ncbi:hypothetical protein DNJ95_13135 [Stutzerimonas kirkiae]|uniref:Uncharacterized protein n=1 Tax=Stutzerimonas kirkiae TaxID=2211392 RepID=A0A4Q9R831_9GAMM|nr:hypothetical protein DNJ96_09565 [Stutzerimonas kirkiae]TBV01044.1 hypothetical protein DNJ95_13135 [Stutzerimonas kirkiae]TBV08392.1 hypothetical protein DNK08_10775 [Stutzerimonas kirkiae]TBV16663.1 hypothetical protein DNK01_02040 [Stutzerimonas kirkiae]